MLLRIINFVLVFPQLTFEYLVSVPFNYLLRLPQLKFTICQAFILRNWMQGDLNTSIQRHNLLTDTHYNHGTMNG